MKEAPLYIQSRDVACWLLRNLVPSDPLGRRIHEDALSLLDHIVLALKSFEREHNIDEADARTALLRVHLRLAHDLGQLDEKQMLFLTGELDAIGRQLGGWQRRRNEATITPRRR